MAEPLPGPAGLGRRVMCLMYESVLLFGVVMLAGLVYGVATQQRHALVGTTGLQLFTFAVIGIYFTWFWSQGRQTLAMKTWRLRVVTLDGQPISQARAFGRYALSWLWFMPALLAVWLAGVRDPGSVGLALTAGMVAYLLFARLNPSRQYLHDLLCGTRIDAAPREKKAQPA